MKVLLLNAHSPQNAGDLALLEQSLAHLRAAFPHADLSYVINQPDPPEWLPADVAYIRSIHEHKTNLIKDAPKPRRKWLMLGLAMWLVSISLIYRWTRIKLKPAKTSAWRELLDHYFEADVTAAIGGGYLYATKAFDLNYIWVWLGVALPVLMSKPLVMLPQSFGPVTGKINQMLLAWLVNRSVLAYAREERSQHYLYSIGINQPVPVVPDVAFNCPTVEPTQAEHYLARWWQPAKRPALVVGITAMDFGIQHPGSGFSHGQRYEQALLDLIQHIGQHDDVHILLFAQCVGASQAEDDRVVARRLIAQLPADTPITFIDDRLQPAMLKQLYSQLDLLIATRLHSAIFALSTTTPSFVIGYLHKSAGVMQMLGLADYQIPIESIDSANLIRAFEQTLAAQGPIKTILHSSIPALQSQLEGLPSQIRAAVGDWLRGAK
ncbi:polysaccharide pyruvyl transferase family protein [Herpetosiphon gulosus]|uniref:Polysaccharide pyruvyl transferase domain-containing protein n=1 Tax=Herpetosiphon gulosus TaxID=1973496 RepID=A0ABP9X1Z9_9CHLR